MIDFSELALSPNESRAARNFLGLSQAQAATKSNLPAHKIKRFETGNYVPDTQFLQDLRTFFEEQGFDFNDVDSPGAKAKARGDVFQAGVVGESGSGTGETVVLPRWNREN
jgi:DNA-binding XRE family transcriptional regulator